MVVVPPRMVDQVGRSTEAPSVDWIHERSIHLCLSFFHDEVSASSVGECQDRRIIFGSIEVLAELTLRGLVDAASDEISKCKR